MKKSLKKMLLVPPITLIVLFGAIIYYFANVSLINPLVLKKLNADFSMGYDILDEKYPGDWSIKDNSLYKGAQIMNDHSELVDKIKRSCGSEATIFQKNVRVATSIQKEDGTRAIGTKVSPEVESMVLLQGKEYIGQTTVVGKPFQTKYMPLKDKDGNIVGMWFIGVSRQDVKTFNIQLGLFIGLIVVIALVLITLVSTTIDKKIKRIAGSLGQGVREINLATGQVSSASQSLAEGASEQAAAIEETSSSLEEMASMTKQNADNAVQADQLMKETNSVVATAVESMSELTGSMADISKSSGETSKIIKTIDEIAFQTNLLALNAAVEAARAGEAGAGFAVVADEVRSLAMRAAAAAKNTADLIEDTVKKINHGSQIVAKTNTAFEQVAQNSSKVGALVSEIAAGSGEQASGIGQINKAVAEMDKVVQQNAANAEETAAAGEELNAQATDMKSVAGELLAIVTGEQHVPQQADGLPRRSPAQKAARPFARPMQANALPAASKKTPQQIIPMDEDDFRDF